MDAEAIFHAEDAVLKRNGLIADGDIIRLRVFCRSNTTNERKSQLKTILGSPKRTVKGLKNQNNHKTLYLSWENFDRKKDKWCIVKADKGGGSKQVKIPLNSTKDDILKQCIELYWDKRNKKCFTDSYFMLADYKHESIGDFIDNGNDLDLPFTLGNYCDFYKVGRPRIFFRTKPKSAYQRLVDNVSTSKTDSDDDFQPSTSSLRDHSSSSAVTTPRIFSSSTPINASLSPSSSRINPPVIDITQDSMELEDGNSHLVTTREEQAEEFEMNQDRPIDQDRQQQEAELQQRREIIQQQDRDFEEALIQDRQIDQNRQMILEQEEKESEELERLEQLRVDRLARVQPELLLEEDHVVIAVRHPGLKNTLTRFFKPESLMSAVYDWVGSLSTQPENFQLYNAERVPVAPFHKTEAGVYNMREIDQPLLMTHSGTVAFQGYGVVEDSLPEEQSEIRENDVIQEKRNVSCLALKDETVTGTVDRGNILKTLISFYSNTCANQYQTLVLTLQNENAVGDGVAKDAISSFFEQFSQNWEGSREVVPNIMERNSEIIGKIITHSFILYDMFPTQISRASLIYYLFGTIDENDLVNSFYNHLPEKEAEMLQKFNHSSSQAATDIFAEFQIFEMPTEGNIKRLCREAGEVCLIQRPCFQMMQLAKGLEFFKSFGPKNFENLYAANNPTSDLLIEKIAVVERSNHEQKITTWLHRYIRSCNTIELSTFLRFFTASSSMPKMSIKLEYMDQPTSYLRPMSQTCFCILLLPRQYQTFSQLRNNLNKWIQNDNSENWQMQDE